MSLFRTTSLWLLVCAATAGSASAATITSNSSTIIGTPLADNITALASQVVVFGLAGNDVIHGGPGDNRIYGDGSCPPGATDASYCSTAVTPNDGNDTIYGGGGQNVLYGQGGNDIIRGGSGPNYIDGGPGNDIIYAGPGRNVLIGAAGRDTIYGGSGRSVIYARDGEKDTIVCSSKGDDVVYADTLDVISGPCGDEYVR